MSARPTCRSRGWSESSGPYKGEANKELQPQVFSGGMPYNSYNSAEVMTRLMSLVL